MDREKLAKLLTLDEGIKSKVYPDSKGIPTIGIGRNLRDKGLSKEEIYHLYHNDVDEVEVNLDQHLAWWKRLDETRQLVLADMCFNLGIGGLLEFKHMLAHAMLGNFPSAAAEMEASLWFKQVGPRAVRLREMMLKGDQP